MLSVTVGATDVGCADERAAAAGRDRAFVVPAADEKVTGVVAEPATAWPACEIAAV
jgi:hypothetical protein